MVSAQSPQSKITTYDQMPMSRIADQLRGKAVCGAFQHPKSLAKYQITHDIEHQPLTPVRRIPRAIPPFGLLPHTTSIGIPTRPTAQQLTPHPHIRNDIFLQRADGGIAEGAAHHPPLARVLHLIDGGVHAHRRGGRRKRFVEIGLLDVRPKPVDALQPRRRVDAEQVGPQPHVGAILGVRIVKGEVARAFVGVPGEVYVCDFG